MFGVLRNTKVLSVGVVAASVTVAIEMLLAAPFGKQDAENAHSVSIPHKTIEGKRVEFLVRQHELDKRDLAPRDVILAIRKLIASEKGEWDAAILSRSRIVIRGRVLRIGDLADIRITIPESDTWKSDELKPFHDAVRRQPDQPEPYLARARRLLRHYENDEAVRDLREALSLNSSYFEARLLLADAESFAGRHREALHQLAEAEKTRGVSWRSAFLRAQILRSKGTLEKAESSLRKALTYSKSQKERGRTWVELCRVQLAQGKYLLATKSVHEALRESPGEGYIHAEAARLYSQCPVGEIRDGDRALRHAKRALELSKARDAYLLSVLASAHAEKGNWDKALASQKKAVSNEPQNRDFVEQLESIKNKQPIRLPAPKSGDE